MGALFNEILYRPLLNAVVFLYNIIPGSDFGIAIAVLTIAIRVIFLPLTLKTMRSQKALNDIQPKIKDIREKHKNDQAAQSAAILKAYRDHKVNPFAGCLPLLIQIPVLLALYRAFASGISAESFSLLYSFIQQPGTIDTTSFGFIDINAKNYFLTIIAGFAQFIQIKTTMASSSGASKEVQAMNSQMMYLFPIIIVVVGWSLPAGLMIYWIVATLASIGEQVYIKKILSRT